MQILSITAFAAGASAHVTIDGITFYDGDIDSASFSGGGLFVRAGGNITINACIFSDNTATGFFQDPNAGGAFLRAAGTLTLTNSTFRDNVADILGGGVYIFGEPGENVIVTNNTFSGNTSKSSTIGGGGIYMKLWGTTDIYNNIIWGNTASSGGDIYLAKSTSTVNLYNNDFNDLAYDDGTNLTQVNNIDQNPLLTTDSHIQESSPCIDAGNNGAPLLPALDFEDDNRIIGSAPDIGADEYLPPIPTLSEKAMIIFIVFMGLIAVYYMKKKRALN